MRVIAGTARRLTLKAVSGNHTRPTTDRIKETLFNMIQPDLADCRFLDLFSGSGAIGIEALSRGAAHAVFVENNRDAIQCIKNNLSTTKLIGRSEILTSDVSVALHRLEGQEAFDFIFMDPPYDQYFEKRIIEYLQNSSLADQNTVIIAEASKETAFDYLGQFGFRIIRIKEYKTNVHAFMERKEE